MKVRVYYHGIEVEVDFGGVLIPTTQQIGTSTKYMQTADKLAVEMVRECTSAIKKLQEGRDE